MTGSSGRRRPMKKVSAISPNRVTRTDETIRNVALPHGGNHGRLRGLTGRAITACAVSAIGHYSFDACE